MGSVVTTTVLAIVRPEWRQLPAIRIKLKPARPRQSPQLCGRSLSLASAGSRQTFSRICSWIGNQLQSHGLRLIGWSLVRQVHADNDVSEGTRSQRFDRPWQVCQTFSTPDGERSLFDSFEFDLSVLAQWTLLGSSAFCDYCTVFKNLHRRLLCSG